jgi:hypothetical protein
MKEKNNASIEICRHTCLKKEDVDMHKESIKKQKGLQCHILKIYFPVYDTEL